MRRLLILLAAGLSFVACGQKKTENVKQADEKAIFEQAQEYEKSQEYSKACDLYQSVIDNYPKSSFRYKAMFMLGYTQLEYLKDNKKAASSFEALLREYPKSDLADDAKVMRDAAISGRDLDSIFQDSLKNK